MLSPAKDSKQYLLCKERNSLVAVYFKVLFYRLPVETYERIIGNVPMILGTPVPHTLLQRLALYYSLQYKQQGQN